MGKIQINSLKDLTKVGSVLNKDFHEPSIFDLDDLQIVPREFIENSKTTNCLTSSSSTSSLSSSESPTSHSFLSNSKKNEHNEESTNEFKFKTSGNFSDDDVENENENEKFKEKNNTSKINAFIKTTYHIQGSFYVVLLKLMILMTILEK